MRKYAYWNLLAKGSLKIYVQLGQSERISGQLNHLQSTIWKIQANINWGNPPMLMRQPMGRWWNKSMTNVQTKQEKQTSSWLSSRGIVLMASLCASTSFIIENIQFDGAIERGWASILVFDRYSQKIKNHLKSWVSVSPAVSELNHSPKSRSRILP